MCSNHSGRALQNYTEKRIETVRGEELGLAIEPATIAEHEI